MDDTERLIQLINGGYSCISIVTHEEKEVLEITRQAAMGLRLPMLIWSVGLGVREGLLAESDAVADTGMPAAALCYLGKLENKTLCVTLDIAEHLKDDITRRIFRDTLERMERSDSLLVMIDSKNQLPPVIKSYTLSFNISLPDERDIEKLIVDTLQKIHRKKPIEVGISRKGMEAIISNLRGLTRRQAEQLIRDTVIDDNRFDDEDVNRVIAGKRRMIQSDGLLEFIQTPLDLDEIGGMNNLKKWLKLRKNAFGNDAAGFGLTAPRGILMLGIQGAGKSLCAKAVATAWRQPLLRLDPSVLYNSYIGESENNLRKALKQTEMMAPVILWIDEIEKGFASAASQSTDGGLSKRMFGTLLTWMQDHEMPVFVIATANDVEALPPELLRKGRFDEIFFVGLPDVQARKMIFCIHLKKRSRDPEKFDLEKLVNASNGYSGAEIEQAVLSALYHAYEDNKAELNTEGLIKALKDSPPLSVTMREKVEYLCFWAEGRCVPAD